MVFTAIESFWGAKFTEIFPRIAEEAEAQIFIESQIHSDIIETDLLIENGKKALVMRSVDGLSEELRNDWNQESRSVENVLDLFVLFHVAASSSFGLTKIISFLF